ncbi:serine/threonine-protein kinase Nek5-like [Mustelus asterias]
MLDGELAHEDSQQEEELDTLNQTLTHEQGDNLKQKKWQFIEAGSILEDLANKTLEVTSSQMEATSKADQVMVMNANAPRNRNQWNQKPPDTLLNALLAAQLSSVCPTMCEDGTLTPLKPTKENSDSTSNSASEIEDKERLEPRSDDDDTNFEESEDELTAQLLESLQKLFHPEEKTRGIDGEGVSQSTPDEGREQENESQRKMQASNTEGKPEECCDERDASTPDPQKDCTEQNVTTALE